MENKILAIIQARSSSSRLPNKILKKIYNEESVVEYLYKKISNSKLISKTVIATSTHHSDDKLSLYLTKKNINFYRGNLNNVYKRFIQTAKNYNCEIIVRITADCPLIDLNIVDSTIINFFNNDCEYSSNILPATFPDGMDVEVFSKSLLIKNFKNIKSNYDKEHVTTFFRRSKNIKKINLINKTDLSYVRLTIDDAEDLKNIRGILKKFNRKKHPNLNNIIKYLKSDGRKYYREAFRNDYANFSKAQSLWKKAKTLIPGGNMLISKRGEFFLPDLWPNYYKKAKGCNIWDLDNVKYLDVNLMGVGTNILGYANSKIDNSVIESLKNGNMSSLNCYEEIELSEKLLSLNSWASKIKFAKTGGEANAIAIRIARSFSKTEKIAICGYHGWHDWYLSSNLNQKHNLSGHLLDGFYTSGVPNSLKNTVFPFEYNKIDQFKKIVKTHKIKILKMEVQRNIPPVNNFLKEIREICNKNKIVLIFDECTSGFRETFGGIYKKYKVTPDIVIFGKALGNGYPITAVLGREEVMEHANKSFISSTFWTERSGYVAALNTLKEMERVKSWEYITKLGQHIKKKWAKISKNQNLKMNIGGLDALPTFSMDSTNWLKYKTFITQEMLKINILASNTIYVSTSHNINNLKIYFDHLESLCSQICEFEQGKKNIDNYLETNVCQSTFSRLN